METTALPFQVFKNQSYKNSIFLTDTISTDFLRGRLSKHHSHLSEEEDCPQHPFKWADFVTLAFGKESVACLYESML